MIVAYLEGDLPDDPLQGGQKPGATGACGPRLTQKMIVMLAMTVQLTVLSLDASVTPTSPMD